MHYFTHMIIFLAFAITWRPLTFHILILSSETPQPNELTLGRKHLWKVHYKDLEYKPISSCQIAAHRSLLSTT